jgi:hypothetical protein
MLPPGAMFCGTTTLAGGDGGPHNEQTEIATNLWDQQIFNFYNPIVTANGCTLKPMMTSSSPPVSSTTFDCTNGGGGGIVASGTMQFLDLSYVPPGM